MTAVKMDLDRDGIKIAFPYDQDLLYEVKRIPGRKPVYQDGHFAFWLVPLVPGVAGPLATFAKIAKAQVPADIQKALEAADLARAANWSMSAAQTTTAKIALPATMADKIRPFQKAGVEYGLKNPCVLIGDEMGLGKTLQALAILEASGSWPALIVCPASLKYNWRNEVARWLPDHLDHVLVLNGKAQEPGQSAHVVIVNYEMVGKHGWLWRVPWKAIVVDESHYIKNEKAKRTGFVLDLANNIDRVILLSGTPVLNKPVELVPQLKALKVLDRVFGGFWPFVRRHCNAYKSDWGWVFDGADNLDELNRKLRETCYLRRDKAAVLPELPPKIRSLVPVQIDNRPEYHKAESELIKYIQDQGRVTQKFLEELEARVSQITVSDGLDPDKFRADEIRNYRMEKAQRAARAEALVRIETLKQIAARGKCKLALDWILDFLEDNPTQKLVVFATHADIINELREGLKAHYMDALVLTGETSAADRDRYINLFQTDPLFRVFIANIQAGGVGITLTAASHELFVEFGWNPGTMDQAEDRCHRIGQPECVNVYWMIGNDTIDEATTALIEHKRDVVDQTTDGDLDQIAAYLNRKDKTK